MGRLPQTPTLRGHKWRLRTQVGITPISTDEDIEPLPKAAVTRAILVQRCQRAVEMGVHVVRAFVQLRELLASNQELAKRLDQLEARLDKKLVSHDEAIAAILSAIRQLMHPPPAKRRSIGFTADISDPK